MPTKLTIEEVNEIRERARNGESGASIARSIGMTGDAVRRVIRGDSWMENSKAVIGKSVAKRLNVDAYGRVVNELDDEKLKELGRLDFERKEREYEEEQRKKKGKRLVKKEHWGTPDWWKQCPQHRDDWMKWMTLVDLGEVEGIFLETWKATEEQERLIREDLENDAK